MRAFVVGGSEAVTLCLDDCHFLWGTVGKFVYMDSTQVQESCYAVSVLHGSGLLKVPPGGVARVDYIASSCLPEVFLRASLCVHHWQRQSSRRLQKFPHPLDIPT
jgi:hypothetical protein